MKSMHVLFTLLFLLSAGTTLSIGTASLNVANCEVAPRATIYIYNLTTVPIEYTVEYSVGRPFCSTDRAIVYPSQRATVGLGACLSDKVYGVAPLGSGIKIINNWTTGIFNAIDRGVFYFAPSSRSGAQPGDIELYGPKTCPPKSNR